MKNSNQSAVPVHFIKSAVSTFNNITETINSTTYPSAGKIFPRQLSIVIGFIFTFFCVLGFVTNILSTRVVFLNRKHLNSSSNQILILSILGLLTTVVLIPLNIVASFNQEFSIGSSGCKIYGFLFTLIGLMYVTIYAVSVIQAYRIIVTNAIESNGFEWRSNLCIFGSCVFTCGSAAVCPMIGISDYLEVQTPIMCHIRWKAFSVVDKTFSISTLVLFFIVPCTVIPVLYTAIYNKVSQRPLNCNDRRTSYMVKTFVISAGMFMLAWIPYAILAMLETFGTMDFIESSSVQIMASLIAKVSLTWTPTIYLYRHRKFQRHYKEMMDTIAEKISLFSNIYNLDSLGKNKKVNTPIVAAITDSAASNISLLKFKSTEENIQL